MKEELEENELQKKESPQDSAKSLGADEILINKDTDIIKEVRTDIDRNSGKIAANPFPMNGMPEVLADLINDSVKVYASPLEYFACTLLVACGSVVRKNAVVDDGKFKNYPQLWLMYIGSSGIGKDMPLNPHCSKKA